MSLGNTPWIWCGLIKGNWRTQRCSGKNELRKHTGDGRHREHKLVENNVKCCMWLNPRKRLRISSASPVKIISIMLILLRRRRATNLNRKLTMRSSPTEAWAMQFIRFKPFWDEDENIIAALYISNSLMQTSKNPPCDSILAFQYLCDTRIPLF